MNLKVPFITFAVLVPGAAFSQSAEPVTREQVRAELMQLENAGYNPLSNCTGDCRGSLLRAEAILTRHHSKSSGGYGPAFDGTEQSGK